MTAFSPLKWVANQLLQTAARVEHRLTVWHQRSTVTEHEDGVDGSETVRKLHFFRGMLDFNPKPAFLKVLRQTGFDPYIFHFSAEEEGDLLRTWKKNAVEVVKHFIRHPEDIGHEPVFVGHSAGGFTVYILAVIREGKHLEQLRSALSGLEDVTLQQLEELSRNLQDGLFITLGVPFKGILLNIVGEFLNHWIVESRVPHLIKGLLETELFTFYDKVGLFPKDVINANIVGLKSWFSFYDDNGEVFISGCMAQGSLMLISSLTKKTGFGDIIVDARSAVLEISVETLCGDLNHLELVTLESGGHILVRNIHEADSFRRTRPPKAA